MLIVSKQTDIFHMPNIARGLFPNIARGILPNIARGILPNIARGILPNIARGIFSNIAKGLFPPQTFCMVIALYQHCLHVDYEFHYTIICDQI